MHIDWVFARIVIILVAVLASGPVGAANFGGRYHAYVPGGTLNLVLVQDGDRIAGRLDGIKGYVYDLNAELKPEGMVGTARTKKGRIFFAGKQTASGLRIHFAEADAKGQPNLAKARQIVFAAGAPAALPPSRPALAAAALPSLKQCSDTHSACISRCAGQWKCIEANCDAPYKQCTANRRASGAGANDRDQVNGILREQHRTHVQNMDCIGDHRLC